MPESTISIAEQVARRYFDYSNQSDMRAIGSLFHQHCTYYSAHLGFFIGHDDIIAMQRQFHGQYQHLHWQIDQLTEIKPGVIDIDFSFDGVLADGELQSRQGKEHILVVDGLIQYIAVGIE